MLQNLKPENFENLIIAIVLDFTKPYLFLDQLSKWADVIFEISKKLPTTKQNELRKKLEDHFRLYKNPDKQDDIANDNEESKEQTENDDEMNEAIMNMPLDDGILNVNLGIPIIVIWNKSEVVASGETIKYFQTRFEFIMKHIREFALRYGASIIFTSTKKGTNLEELYTYLLHRYFDLNPVSPEITNKESILIPTGYDSPKLIQQLWPNIDDPYDKIVIRVRATKEMVEEDDIVCDSLDEVIESLSELQNNADEEKENTTQVTVQKKKVDPNTFFKNLKEGGIKKRESNVNNNPKDKTKNVEDFKKKLFLKNIDT